MKKFDPETQRIILNLVSRYGDHLRIIDDTKQKYLDIQLLTDEGWKSFKRLLYEPKEPRCDACGAPLSMFN